MPKFVLDGKEIEFEQGQTIIQAAKKHGIDIPHFAGMRVYRFQETVGFV